jgi:hypothetical protein
VREQNIFVMHTQKLLGAVGGGLNLCSFGDAAGGRGGVYFHINEKR